jgi:2-methylcitrate dehydratase PrpD
MVELTRRLADWAVKMTYEDLPQPVKEKAKCCILDCSGVTLAAVKSDVGQIFRTLLPELGGLGPCSVLGSGKRGILQRILIKVSQD